MLPLKISRYNKIIALISALALHGAVLGLDIESPAQIAPKVTKIDFYKIPKPISVEPLPPQIEPVIKPQKTPRKKALRPKKAIIMPDPPAVLEKTQLEQPAPTPPEQPPALGLKPSANTASDNQVVVNAGISLSGIAGGAANTEKNETAHKVRTVTAEALSKLPKPKGPCNIPFPEEAERLGLEGDVILSLDIDENGKVSHVKLLKGISPLLDQAAIRGIENCRFVPAQSGGEKVAVLGLTYRYSFVLEF